jgi:single-strand DNA-binding protein
VRDLNRVQPIGHLGHDLDGKDTERGVARTTFSVATSQRWKDTDGHGEETTEWSRCVAWGALAEVCAQYVTKGSHVYAAGRLHTLRWQDAETGERHARVEIVLDDLILLDRRGVATTTADEAAEAVAAFAPRAPVPPFPRPPGERCGGALDRRPARAGASEPGHHHGLCPARRPHEGSSSPTDPGRRKRRQTMCDGWQGRRRRMQPA